MNLGMENGSRSFCSVTSDINSTEGTSRIAGQEGQGSAKIKSPAGTPNRF